MRLLTYLLLFCATFGVYGFAHITQLADSNYSMMLSQSLIDHGSFRLDSYDIPRKPQEIVEGATHFDPYQLIEVNQHLYYYYPNGSSVLSVPFVALMNMGGVSAVTADQKHYLFHEALIGRIIAALLMAGFVGLVFTMARRFLPMGFSLVVTAATAFGTQVFSTASRAMWSHTWGIFLLGCVLVLVIRLEEQKKTSMFLMATLLSWMYFVRPTFSISILAITGYMFFHHRTRFLRYALTGALWFGLFVCWSWYNFGRLLPHYYSDSAGYLGFDTFWIALAGNLVSPSRGLLVYSPFLLFTIYLLIRYRKYMPHAGLVFMGALVCVVHLVTVSGFPNWWGGHSFGPRLMTDVVPWLMLLTILGIAAWRSGASWRVDAPSAHENRRPAHKIEVGVALFLVVLSIGIHTTGATRVATSFWNVEPETINQTPERLWDYTDPQFLHGLFKPDHYKK